ncbi:MAG: periplasmic heavy metal sensor [Desulfobacteraceae bacterium]|nr:MAG: periplasmic heavy metal sensor [Desulfobacteraceae bacterium]
MKRSQSLPGFLVDDPVVFDGGFPAHSADQTDRFHFQSLFFYFFSASFYSTIRVHPQIGYFSSAGCNPLRYCCDVSSKEQRIHINDFQEVRVKRRFLSGLSIAIGLLFVLILASTAVSGPFGRSQRNARGLMGLKTILELNLSEEQRSEALQIIERFQSFRNSAGDEMQKARKDLAAAVSGESLSEDEVRAAFRRSATIREDLFVERIRTKAALRKLLTPEQLELLKRQRPGKWNG